MSIPQGRGAGQAGARWRRDRSSCARPSAVWLPCHPSPFWGPQHLSPELFQTFMPASVAPARPSANFSPCYQSTTKEIFLHLMSRSAPNPSVPSHCPRIKSGLGDTQQQGAVPDFCLYMSPVRNHASSVLRPSERLVRTFPLGQAPSAWKVLSDSPRQMQDGPRCSGASSSARAGGRGFCALPLCLRSPCACLEQWGSGAVTPCQLVAPDFTRLATATSLLLEP